MASSNSFFYFLLLLSFLHNAPDERKNFRRPPMISKREWQSITSSDWYLFQIWVGVIGGKGRVKPGQHTVDPLTASKGGVSEEKKSRRVFLKLF